ncbi:hypothetical protein GCM10027093_01700 [Paraburkholderia jirisanensis]
MKLDDRIRRSISQARSSCAESLRGWEALRTLGGLLAHLVEDGALVGISKGAFARTPINKFAGRQMAAGSLESIAAELFNKLGIEVTSSRFVQEYNSGKRTQVPNTAIANTGRHRITRKVTMGNRTLVYEKRYRRSRV